MRWVVLTAVVLWLLNSALSMGAEAVVEILVQSSLTAGLSHHEAKGVWDQLKVGDPLTLVRESDNPNDANAVRLDWSGHKLGYIPRTDNEAIARQLDRGNKLEARISRLGQYRNHRRKLEVEVYLRM